MNLFMKLFGGGLLVVAWFGGADLLIVCNSIEPNEPLSQYALAAIGIVMNIFGWAAISTIVWKKVWKKL